MRMRVRRCAAGLLLALALMVGWQVFRQPISDPCEMCFEVFPAWICYLEGCGWLW